MKQYLLGFKFDQAFTTIDHQPHMIWKKQDYAI